MPDNNESLTIPDRVALNPTVAARYSVSDKRDGDVEYVRVGAEVDLKMLPYEIAERLPEIGGMFGDLASMCKSTVADFIEKMIAAASSPLPAEKLQPWRDKGGHAWEVKRNVTCVECPHCCFTFAAIHTIDPEDYDCPNCEGCPDAAPAEPAQPTPLIDAVLQVVEAEGGPVPIKWKPAPAQPEGERVGHAGNPDAFCLVCNEHPCKLSAAPVVPAGDDEGETEYDRGAQWGIDHAQSEYLRGASELHGRIASRDTEIRKVLEGLGKSVGDSWCWCPKTAKDGNGSVFHSPACLATRALWEKVQP